VLSKKYQTLLVHEQGKNPTITTQTHSQLCFWKKCCVCKDFVKCVYDLILHTFSFPFAFFSISSQERLGSAILIEEKILSIVSVCILSIVLHYFAFMNNVSGPVQVHMCSTECLWISLCINEFHWNPVYPFCFFKFIYFPGANHIVSISPVLCFPLPLCGIWPDRQMWCYLYNTR